MAKLSIQAGATSQSVNIFIQNSSVSTGAGLTGLAYNTGSLIAYYTFTGANATATVISLATLAAVNSAYSSGGFKEIDSTHMPGMYRFDIPTAVLAASSGQSVAIMLSGATNMAPLTLEIELTGWNNQDAVRGGLSALPNAAAGASGGLLISGSNSGTTTLAALTVTGNMSINGSNTTAQSGDAYARLGAPTGASVSADILAAPATLFAANVDGSKTFKQYMQWMAAALFGKLSGVSTNSPVFLSPADGTTTRISATTTSDGRSSVTLS